MPTSLLTLLVDPPPRHDLGVRLSPVVQLPELARHFGAETLCVKREDLNGTRFGGNKLRALEWLLPSATGSIVSLGGYGSTWCAALATAGRSTGREVHVALFPQPWSPSVAGVLTTTMAGSVVHLARRPAGLPLALARAWLSAQTYARPTLFGPGGSTPLGVLGSISAALEFAGQIEAGAAPAPGAVVVPLGSGGTAAGLLLGCQIAGLPVTICAVRVGAPLVASERRVRSLVRRTRALLRRCGLALPDATGPLTVITDQLGPGYGQPTAAAIAARTRFAEQGLDLDLTYTAKTAAALQGLAGSFRHLTLWHTFDSRLAPPPGVEPPLVRQARISAESLWPHPKST